MLPNSGGKLGVRYNNTKKPVSDGSCRVLRVSHSPVRCCGGVAVLLRWRCGAAAVLRKGCGGFGEVLRWSGQSSQSESMVRSVVRSMIWSAISSLSSGRSGGWPRLLSEVDGPVVRSVVRSMVRSAIQSAIWPWSGQSVVRSVRSVVRSKHVLLHTPSMAGWLQMPGHRSPQAGFPLPRASGFARSGVAVVLP